MMKRIAIAAAFFVLLSLPLNVTAGIEPSPFLLPDLAGFDNPMFWVMFNPQPEPPGSWLQTDYTNPEAPVFTVRSGSGNFPNFPVSFGILGGTVDPTTGLPTVPLTFIPTYAHNEIAFSISKPGSLTPLDLLYTATFSFGSDVMFNPQPEPPGTPWTTFCLLDPTLNPTVDPTTGQLIYQPFQGSEVTMTFRLADGGGNPVSLESVPEPTTMLLLGLGLVGLAGARRKFQK
jgi:hypothetical protein